VFKFTQLTIDGESKEMLQAVSERHEAETDQVLTAIIRLLAYMSSTKCAKNEAHLPQSGTNRLLFFPKNISPQFRGFSSPSPILLQLLWGLGN